MDPITKQRALRLNSLVKATILNERSARNLRTFRNPNHPIPQLTTMMIEHNDVVGVINALIAFVETLRQRIEELENA